MYLDFAENLSRGSIAQKSIEKCNYTKKIYRVVPLYANLSRNLTTQKSIETSNYTKKIYRKVQLHENLSKSSNDKQKEQKKLVLAKVLPSTKLSAHVFTGCISFSFLHLLIYIFSELLQRAEKPQHTVNVRILQKWSGTRYEKKERERERKKNQEIRI